MPCVLVHRVRKLLGFPWDNTREFRVNLTSRDKVLAYKTIERLDKSVAKDVAVGCNRPGLDLVLCGAKFCSLAQHSFQRVLSKIVPPLCVWRLRSAVVCRIRAWFLSLGAVLSATSLLPRSLPASACLVLRRRSCVLRCMPLRLRRCACRRVGLAGSVLCFVAALPLVPTSFVFPGRLRCCRRPGPRVVFLGAWRDRCLQSLQLCLSYFIFCCGF